jgi:hydrogenase maturation protein HypF
MTSGNLSEEPIEVKNKTAMKHLAAIADYYLVHNREIYNRCDDSIVRVIKAKGGKTPDEQIILRRARGYVPLPFELGIKKNSILACGAEENSTFCLTKDKRAFMSQYIGDLKSFCNMDYYRETIERFKGIFHIKPEVLAFDMHPDYFSTQYAIDYAHSNGCSLIPVQHHHAHLAGCMLENNLKKRVIGVIFDGTGYGADGRIWGGEWLIGDYKGFTRAAYLKYTAMPGGDMVVEEPWRMAISYLHNAYGGKMPDIGFVKKYRSKIQPVAAMIENGINSPFSSSMGRLFDGVAALLGICEAGTYDAQPAMELEYAALSSCKRDNYPAGIEDNGSCCIVDTGSIIRAIVEDIVRGTDKADIALKFHFTVVNTTVKICCIIRDKTGLNDVVLSGGVFQNKIILQESIKKLISGGFSVHFNRQYPCNDGGISFGQMAVAIYKLT